MVLFFIANGKCNVPFVQLHIIQCYDLVLSFLILKIKKTMSTDIFTKVGTVIVFLFAGMGIARGYVSPYFGAHRYC